MAISTYEAQVKRYEAEIQKLERKRAAAEEEASKAETAALRLEEAAARASSASIAGSKLRQAQSTRKEASRAREAAAKASKAIADIRRKLIVAERKLRETQAKEAAKERREQERAERRRQAEIDELRGEHEQLASHIASEPWADAPEEITVLFIAADPDSDNDQPPLRLDREVAEIQRRLRMTEYRDSVKFVPRLAARSVELMQFLNETRPHVVHFSGHGNQHGLVFEDADGKMKVLDNGQLASLLSVASDRIRLAIFNSCESSAQAELATSFIDAAIGMEQPIGDTSAKIFAAQFYNSLGFGYSLQKAFDQARAQLKIETGGVSGNPQLFVADGLDASDIYLVAPDEPLSSVASA